jgi:transcriptional regulator with XRE-family HTH domain
MRRTKNFADVIRAKMAASSELADAIERQSFNADIAQKVHDLRTDAGLTQKQLADLIETQQSVISRIEDADYDGHSLNMLKRIATALKRNLRVEFCAPLATTRAGNRRYATPGQPQPGRKRYERRSATTSG